MEPMSTHDDTQHSRHIELKKILTSYYCDQIERWILNLNFPGFSKLKIFFSISW